jgi:hypothetical protein
MWAAGAVGVLLAGCASRTADEVASASVVAPRRELEVAEVHGDVALIDAEGRARSADLGGAIAVGDAVQTGADGTARLATPSGATVRVGRSTTARLVHAGDGALELELERGQVRARVRPGAGAVQVRAGDRVVRTEDGEVGVARDGTRVVVETTEGAATVEGKGGPRRVPAGQRVGWRGEASWEAPVGDAPLLDVAWPTAPVARARWSLVGRVEPGATVRVLSVADVPPVVADDTGAFTVEVPLAEGETTVVLEVTDAFGRVRTASGRMVRDTTAPTLQLEIVPIRR